MNAANCAFLMRHIFNGTKLERGSVAKHLKNALLQANAFASLPFYLYTPNPLLVIVNPYKKNLQASPT